MTTPTTTVPTEPTEAMIEAGAEAYFSAPGDLEREDFAICYRAMLAAAPDPLPQGVLREAVARVLAKQRGHIDIGHSIWMNEAKSEAPVWHFYLEDADAILALLTAARSGCKLAAEYEDWQPLPEAPSVGGEP